MVYISMGFGNPYGDIWNADLVAQWVQKMDAMGIRILSLSDTIGIANPNSISYIFSGAYLNYRIYNLEPHLHTTPNSWEEKMGAAWQSGCRRFDGAIKGLGGCPMATDKLTGNMPTENMISFLQNKGIETGLNLTEFQKSILLADSVFPAH